MLLRVRTVRNEFSMKPYFTDKGIVIYHGDCREVLPSMPMADLLLTDPPYGINYKHGLRRGGVALGTDSISIVGDDEPFEPRFMLDRATKIILWGANHYAERLPSTRGWLVWDKRGGVNINDQSDCELAWTNFLTTVRMFYRQWNGAVRGGREQREGRFHVSQKPVELIVWCIGLSKTSGVILDPFMGSGTTLRAAKDLGRQAIGIEIEERYCEIAAKRLSQEVLDFEGAVA